MSQSDLNVSAGLTTPPWGWRGLVRAQSELRGLFAKCDDGQVGEAMRMRVSKGLAAEVGP